MIDAIHVIAVDWSGRADPGQAESIWIAETTGGRLVDLRNGLSRADVAEYLPKAAERHDRLVVGLDFAFSLPAWWLREQRLTDIRDVWQSVVNTGEELIASKPPPFWGASGSTALPVGQRFRRTEEQLRDRGLPTKSVFQLAGPGAVGVGSLRGVPHLMALAEQHGFSVWPFDDPSWPRIIEVYPRALTGPVDKSRFRSRHSHLQSNFVDQDPVLLERAAGSEDAFDAAVSALRMTEHLVELEHLKRSEEETELLEGRIWVPEGNQTTS